LGNKKNVPPTGRNLGFKGGVSLRENLADTEAPESLKKKQRKDKSSNGYGERR